MKVNVCVLKWKYIALHSVKGQTTCACQSGHCWERPLKYTIWTNIQKFMWEQTLRLGCSSAQVGHRSSSFIKKILRFDYHYQYSMRRSCVLIWHKAPPMLQNVMILLRCYNEAWSNYSRCEAKQCNSFTLISHTKRYNDNKEDTFKKINLMSKVEIDVNLFVIKPLIL